MIYEFGSIEIKSPVMISLLQSLEGVSSKLGFVIVGEPGTGKSLMTEYIKKTVFKSNVVEVFENAIDVQQAFAPAIYTFNLQTWAQEKKKFSQVEFRIIQMPTLNERKADLPQLSQFFLQVLAVMNNQPAFKLTDKAIEMICQYEWNGNFHELESVLENAVLIAKEEGSKGWIEATHLHLNLNPKNLDFTVGMKLDEIERRYILQTLYFVHQNRTKAADILGISIRTLRNKINQYREEGYL